MFAALPELLDGVGVFHVIHGDRVHHHHSVILTMEETRAENYFTAILMLKLATVGLGRECGTGEGLVRDFCGTGKQPVRDW